MICFLPFINLLSQRAKYEKNKTKLIRLKCHMFCAHWPSPLSGNCFHCLQVCEQGFTINLDNLLREGAYFINLCVIHVFVFKFENLWFRTVGSQP